MHVFPVPECVSRGIGTAPRMTLPNTRARAVRKGTHALAQPAQAAL